VWGYCIVASFPNIILNQCNCLGGTALGQLFSEAFFQHFNLFINFTFGVFFILFKLDYLMNTCNMFLNIQKIIIGCLIKPPKKNCTQTIFQGGSPWATLIFNSMFVVGVLYCVQIFFEVICFFTKSCSPFLCYSFWLLLSSILLASSPWFLWCFYVL